MTANDRKFIVFIGPPGSGKGTQAKILEQKLGLPQVATGDLFRYNLKNQTELGLLAKKYMDAGELVPDEVTIRMVEDRLSREDCARGPSSTASRATFGRLWPWTNCWLPMAASRSFPCSSWMTMWW
jgi:hypothetical protein